MVVARGQEQRKERCNVKSHSRFFRLRSWNFELFNYCSPIGPWRINIYVSARNYDSSVGLAIQLTTNYNLQLDIVKYNLLETSNNSGSLQFIIFLSRASLRSLTNERPYSKST